MQILVPIAGASPFFSPEDYPFPKPLIEVGGKPMIERVVANLRLVSPDARFVFVARAEDVAQFSLENTLRLLAGDSTQVITLQHSAKGALCSALLAIDLLDEDQPVIVANGDQVIDADIASIIQGFIEKKAAAGVITFESIHPRWSYVLLDQEDGVLRAAEKTVISRNAIAGFYFFENAKTFLQAAMRCIQSGGSHGGLFYIAPSLNELILDGKPVLSHKIPAEKYHSFYAPQKIAEFEKDLMVRSLAQPSAPKLSDVRILLPAAGEGSRFKKAGYPKPKPFIDVLGRPMLLNVVDNVSPPGAEIHVLLRKEHIDGEEEAMSSIRRRGCRVHAVERLTEGTACTLLLARREIDDDRPLLVANSDQLVDFDVSAFVQDCFDRKLDGSILVFRDEERNPKWSFARLGANGLVTEVAEKDPISDLATVGIYFFTSGKTFVKSAIDMIARNVRVNNEFYTCPVYNWAIAEGYRIGVYEIDAKQMHGLGTPEDLDRYLARRAAAPAE